VNLVRQLRYRAGLTQDLFARATGLSTRTISEYESGRTSPKLAMLEHLANVVGFAVVVSFEPQTTDAAVPDSPPSGSPGSG
jgi:transcriptional regulator with XRE-family HTH domain